MRIALRHQQQHLVIDVHRESDADLALTVVTLGAVSLRFRPGQGWQDQCCKDRDDGNNNQQFD
jgi:hypothetical protein